MLVGLDNQSRAGLPKPLVDYGNSCFNWQRLSKYAGASRASIEPCVVT